MKKESREAKELVQKLSRKDRKKLHEEFQRLNKLSQRELHAHLMIKDPNNPFIRKITLEGAEGLAELQRQQIWKSIMNKKQAY